jgi:hypothetical protein
MISQALDQSEPAEDIQYCRYVECQNRLITTSNQKTIFSLHRGHTEPENIASFNETHIEFLRKAEEGLVKSPEELIEQLKDRVSSLKELVSENLDRV